MSELQLADYVRDLLTNANRLQGIVEEVDKHVADGNLDAAAMVLGIQTGKIGRFQESYADLQTKLRDEGADPDRALNPQD